jgi:excisionase family DNA binding protein
MLETTVEMPKLTEYLHTAAAAEYIGVAQNTLRKWAARGKIPMHRNPANGYRLFKLSDLDKFLTKTAMPVKGDQQTTRQLTNGIEYNEDGLVSKSD